MKRKTRSKTSLEISISNKKHRSRNISGSISGDISGGTTSWTEENTEENMEDQIKILCIGDLHYKTNNLREMKIVTDQILKHVREIKPQLIVCLGDTMDKYMVHVTALTQAIGFLSDLSEISYTMLIIGNHDRVNNSDFLSDIHPFAALKQWRNLTVVDKIVARTIGSFGRQLIFVPYVSPGRFQEALDTYEHEINNPLAIFAHQEFYNCHLALGITSSAGDKWDEKNSLVISGHIHDYHIVQDNVIYTGTPYAHAFNESQNKSISLFTFDVEDQSSTFQDDSMLLDVPRKLQFRFEVADIDKITINEGTGSKYDICHGEYDKVKILFVGEIDEIKAMAGKFSYVELSKKVFRIETKAINTAIISKPSCVSAVKIPFVTLVSEELKTNQDPELMDYFKKICVSA